MTYDKPLPNPADPLTAPFWHGLREHRLMVQRCEKCQALRLPAAPLCPECLTSGGTWIEIAAEGALWSYVVYHRALDRSFADEVPYAVGVVTLNETLQLLARIDAPLDELAVGAQMRAEYVDVSADVTLLRWIPQSAVGAHA